ncbi:hypothetical protein HDU86_003110 [Geranomyces michiganensis]|nr:hypothetical protein HDU86_003110 [Geranomyces michiganensis]
MMIPRDEVVLCSSQACILPLPAEGELEFIPELFNYQSREDNPAVLAIVATAQGTSAHVVTEREQKLYFNRNGQATKYLAKRLSQDRAERQVEDADWMGRKTAIDVNPDETLHSLCEKIEHNEGVSASDVRLVCGGHQLDQHDLHQCLRGTDSTGSAPRRGMEHAMLRSADKSEGAFEKNSRVLERDERYPIRATSQFYRVIDEANISKELFTDISAKIESVYDMAEDKGSLVIDESVRKTETTTTMKMKSLPEMAAIPTDAKPLFSAFETADFVVVPESDANSL